MKTQYAMWLIGTILISTFVPFILKHRTVSTFWSYNKEILYAFITAFIYSAFLFAGLCIALASTNFLFDLNIPEKTFFQMWVVIVGFFSTTLFLSRFPNVEPSEIHYPRELRLFSFYILIPLVTLYFLILYSYTAKILFSWVWPKGIISTMIVGFSALGIFTYALLYPLVSTERWLKNATRIFFIALIPQALVLLFAVNVRISDYGITENRYLLVAYGIWLLGISLYFLSSKVKNITLVPISLFILFIAISFGPWGVFDVSEHNQTKRLENILERTQILQNNKVVKNTSRN
jgi:hypothetical protein